MQKIWFDRRKLLKRESNIELLRIISMFFILFGHGLQHGFMSLNDINIYEEEIITFLKWTLIWHVNAFLLITGYFGIRFSIRSILSLCINVLFYYIFLCVIIPIYQKEILDIHKIILSPILLIKQGCGWWFIKDYIFLFFIPSVKSCQGYNESPICQHCIIYDIFKCNMWIFFKADFNPTGFCIQHFCYMYILGQGIDRFRQQIIKKNIHISYLVGCIILAYLTSHLYKSEYWRAYNNPFVIISAILVFLFIIKFKFKNIWINYVAESSLAVYLLTDQKELTRPILSKLIHSIYHIFPNIYIDLLIWTLIAIILFVCCILIDKVCKPLLNVIIQIVYTTINRFVIRNSI